MSIPFLLPVNQTLTNSAIAYAALGFRVIPVYGVNEDGSCQCGAAVCKAVGKHPIGHGWQKRSETPPEAVAADRKRYPDANIGLAMGACSLGYLLCVDIDKADAWDELVASLPDRVPDTMESRSGRGRHLFFLAAPHHNLSRLKNRAGLFGGVDVRADGGQVLAAPSRHHSGAVYEWVRPVQPATLPDSLYDAIASPLKVVSSQTQEQVTATRADTSKAGDAYVQAALDNARADVPRIPEGGRNAGLNKLSHVVFQYAVGLGWPESRCVPPMVDAGVAAGLDLAEARATVASAWRAAQG